MSKVFQNSKLCSELIVDFLAEEKKLTHVFDLTGGMITYLEDAISRKKGIECVPVHHEQAAGFAAEGYARIGQHFGVALATSGPGATNLITAIGSCFFDSVPVLFITGQVNTDNLKKNTLIRQDGFQETDVVGMVAHIVKYAVLVTDPNNVLYELEKAYYMMKSGRPGPVLVDIPINIQRSKPTVIKHFFGSYEHGQLEKKDQKFFNKKETAKFARLEKMLKVAKAPLVLIGNGVRISQTTEALTAFIKNNNLPVVSSLMGLDSIGGISNFVGYIGTNGNRDANIIFANADLVIALGTRLDVRQIGDAKLFNKNTELVHVDIDASSVDYHLTSTLSFVMDLNHFFDQAVSMRSPKKHAWGHFINQVQKHFGRAYDTSFMLDPNLLIKQISNAAKNKTTVVVDVGQNQQWCAQSWKTKKQQRLLFSGGMGAMGFALPAAVGAWFANKKNDLVIVTGDGGLQINVQEMETVYRNSIPLKMFVLNNNSLGMVREFQDLYFNKNYQSTVLGYGTPNFKKLADAYGFKYFCITSNTEADTIIAEVLEQTVPVFVEVMVEMMAPLHPKTVYGHALDDQAPYLSDEKKELLEFLKKELYV